MINLCPGTYVWPNDAKVFFNRNETNAELIGTLIINCCGNGSTCIVDGDGQSFSQSLFQFDSPIIFIMKGVKFQNFNYVGLDAAIVIFIIEMGCFWIYTCFLLEIECISTMIML